MFISKRQPVLQGTSSLFSPKTGVLGIKLQALLESEINLSLQGKVSNGFSDLGSFGIRVPVFYLHVYPYSNL